MLDEACVPPYGVTDSSPRLYSVGAIRSHLASYILKTKLLKGTRERINGLSIYSPKQVISSDFVVALILR